MTAGRPRKPRNLHLIDGTLRKDRHGDDVETPVEPEGPIVMPRWLSDRGKRDMGVKLFTQIAPVLEQMRVMTPADVHSLALLCDAYREYVECSAFVREKGRSYVSVVTLQDDDGEEYEKTIWRPRPEVAMAADAWRRVRAMLGEFGMTPSSRARAKVVDGGRARDPFEEFLTPGGRKNA